MTDEVRRWSFTDLEFYVLWSDRTGTGLPFPLRFTARTRDPDRFRRDITDTRAALRDRLGTSFDAVLTALTEPDIRLGINGSDHRDPGDPSSLTRMIGVRRESRGFVVTTIADDNFWYSGGFIVIECDAVRLADVLAAEMPAGVKAGPAEIVLPAAHAGTSPQRRPGVPTVHDTYGSTVEQRGAAFLAAPTSCLGTIHIEQGSSIYGPRGLSRFRLEWRDLAEGGRYVIRDCEPPVALAADAAVLVGIMNSKIAQVVRVIKDERQPV